MAELTFRPSWLSISPLEGAVDPGGSVDLDATFDATGLYGGDYHAVIEINTNDPQAMQVDVPVSLNVTGAPDIFVSDGSVDFGTLYTNYGGSQEVVIGNSGTDVLEISSITVDNTSYSLSFSQATVPYNEEIILIIDFMPLEDGDYGSFLTIVSNDVDESEIIIPISGSAIAPPIISVNPSSLSSNLLTGETETQNLTVFNGGGSDLSFTVNTTIADSRWSMPELEGGEAPTILTLEETRSLWDRNDGLSLESISRTQPIENNTRPTRNWQLLANDPQDNDSPYDTENIYYEVTDTSLNFKYQYYEPWEEPIGNTVAIIYINVDSNLETGLTFDGYDYGNTYEGIDMLIYSLGIDDYDQDGVYVYDGDYYDNVHLLWLYSY